MEKRVRIQNATSDNTFIRVYIEHFQANIGLTADVAPGQFCQNNHMTVGHRGVIVYEDFNEKIIGTSEFVLQNDNIRVIVSGSEAAGYNISFATDP